MSTTAPPHTRWGLTLATAVGSAAVVAVVLLAFLWPSVTSRVHNLPVVVSGSGPAETALHAQLEKAGVFAISPADNRAAAIAAVEARDAYGAFVVAPDGSGVDVLTASAASPVVVQIMNQAAAGISQGMAQQAAAGQAARVQAALASGRLSAMASALQPVPAPKVTVTDVAPLNKQDPRGTGLALLGLPLAMGGMIGGVLISLVVTGFRRRLAAAGAYGVAGGLGLVGILQGWFGILSGPYLLNALAMGLGLFAIAITIVGLESLLGKPGIPVGAVLTMFIGNPISSLTSPLEFLPWHWGEIGQWFVPGATGTLLRDLSYFPNAAQGVHWLVLAAWSAAGIALAILGRHRNEEAVHLPSTLDASGHDTSGHDGGARHGADLSAASA
ncbi:ABC transporter permease [Arthrobacter livingstonensis]|uniref:ABC transporter permease n=1 Tax=Arthrobacter livingstonensis TaxID=670078 RepID=UPI001B8781D2|nr:ABC transporter permease [Arthrobacter livingstonensis]